MRAILLSITLLGLAAHSYRAQIQSVSTAEPILTVPREVTLDQKRVNLGRKLFHDVRLSRNNNQSCATCHPLEKGGMDGRVRAKRADGTDHARNTPTIFNVALNATYNWDGIAYTLGDHTERIIPGLMGVKWADLIARLRADREYVDLFRSAYGTDVTQAAVLDAITAFENSLITPNARFDRYLRGDYKQLTEQEREGYALFKAHGCATCHQGVNIGGNLYQRFGVFDDMTSGKSPLLDWGRFRITQIPRDEYVFRVPSLRNVAITAPYFHDGQTSTLREAVEVMAKAQLGRALKASEIDGIVAFLRTLTGEYRGVRLVPPAKEAR